MSFLHELIEHILEVEGSEYTDNPKDSGGPTKYGVTEAVARAWGYQDDMRDLPRETAAYIFRMRYYFQPNFDKVTAYSEAIGKEVTDTGVNMGTGTAGIFLQRCLNILNRETRFYPDLVVDGVVGRMTIYALKSYLSVRGKEGELVLLRMLNGLQVSRYIEIAERRPKDEEFVYGWVLNRVTI